MKHWTFKRKFCDSVFTAKKGAKVGNVKTSAKLVLFFCLADSQPPPSPLVGVVDVDNNTLSHPGPGYEQKDHDKNPEKPASDIHCA